MSPAHVSAHASRSTPGMVRRRACMARSGISTMSMRDGFTLVEMLVATGVFVLGFVAVYSLFLSGMRFRKLADDTARTATLASTLLTEMYLDSDGGSAGPASPADYNGSGNPSTPETSAVTGLTTPLYSYSGIPGTVYRFSGTTDLMGNSVGVPNGTTPDPVALTTALVTQVFISCPGVVTPTLGDLNRTHLVQGTDQQPLYGNQEFQNLSQQNQALALQEQMVAHGAAMQYTAVIIRQPHWLNQ